MSLDPRLSQIIVVLYEPQDDINIGTTIRACKNFGVRHIRLVRPASANPARILVSAPKAEDIIDELVHYDSLDEALADCVLVLGTTARMRGQTRQVLEPRGAAAQAIEATASGKVALLFGREDHGLPNEALDRCHVMVTAPTDPDYSSLNLGQAVLLMVWELFRLAQDVPIEQPATPLIRPAHSEHPPAEQRALNTLLDHVERAFTEIDFLKPETHHHMMATLRQMFLRSALDVREVAIWHGILSQIDYALERERRKARAEALADK